MKPYLNKILDWQDDNVASQYDELPLWSSPFGLLLLDNFPIRNYETYLDVGFGTGFPLIDIAQRLGENCKSIGIDMWAAAVKRAKKKINTIGLKNIEIIEADASIIPFQDNYFDLITSNLGTNNFENPEKVMAECYRVLKKDSSLCTTSNLKGTFDYFYDIFEKTLKELELTQYLSKFESHVEHRGTIESKTDLIQKSGFRIEKQVESDYTMRFLNGTTFLNHSVIIVGFIDSWRNMLEEPEKNEFFDRFETNLNDFSRFKGELKLTIPMVYFECKK